MFKCLIIFLGFSYSTFIFSQTPVELELNLFEESNTVESIDSIESIKSTESMQQDSGFVNKKSVSETEQFIISQKPMLYVKKVKSPLNVVYKKVYTSLDNNGYFVVFEPNIGRNLAHFAKRWGDDYNKNKLEAIRSMVFCNGWYANKVSNVDPNMMALCPLHLTLIHKEGITSILFVRPGRVAFNSPAKDIANELEQDVIRSIEEALVR